MTCHTLSQIRACFSTMWSCLLKLIKLPRSGWLLNDGQLQEGSTIIFDWEKGKWDYGQTAAHKRWL